MNEAEILSDFKRRYEHTYVFVQEPNSCEKGLFHIDQIDSSPTKTAVLRLSSDYVGSIRLNFGSQHTLQFVVPPIGVFQHGADAIVCLRNPRKQYRRGICSDNTSMYAVTDLLTPRRAHPFTWALVNAAFERRNYSFKEGLSMLNEGKARSVALPNNMALSLSVTDSPEHILFQWAVPIARISNDGKVTHVYEKVMGQQIENLLKETSHASN